MKRSNRSADRRSGLVWGGDYTVDRSAAPQSADVVNADVDARGTVIVTWGQAGSAWWAVLGGS